MKPARHPTHPPALPASGKGASRPLSSGLQAAKCASRKPAGRLCAAAPQSRSSPCGVAWRPTLTAPPQHARARSARPAH
jgi:hypothetical protein